jgi:hypothetical protein
MDLLVFFSSLSCFYFLIHTLVKWIEWIWIRGERKVTEKRSVGGVIDIDWLDRIGVNICNALSIPIHRVECFFFFKLFKCDFYWGRREGKERRL